jgi:hypothetical protein
MHFCEGTLPNRVFAETLMNRGIGVLHIQVVVGEFARELSQGARTVRHLRSQHVLLRELQSHRLQHLSRRVAVVHHHVNRRHTHLFRNHQPHDIYRLLCQPGAQFCQSPALVLHHD